MKKIIILFIYLFLSGCVSTNSHLQTVLAPAENIGNSVECSKGCKDEWNRAQFWIAKHSKLKIQTMSDVMIDTYNAINQDTVFQFTITREPMGNDNYSIVMNLRCGNYIGCHMDPTYVKRAFYYYVKHGKDLLRDEGPFSAIY